ncbi:FDXHR family putative zinc-binding protein [Mycobacterium intracellulare]|uniref:Uncharacterized protein n=1 Tax=Mycobacterium intracellulare subsp. chimaera TaxID=222805 RepID=A0A7U5MMI0_MYCIT|nr:hypothetical protein [Mycobacterium intracellulare]ASL16279.1 hypothetical protein MYCOZU2_03906 [Mycobacterium intracellulare subsp. chimaera]MCF1814932.1 hypothetical protein [Mycobacterium intracellulare subsp. intracellulare]MDM3929577.1 hypothetical protein [Mycobacterium intracellulare subsp. chimaera]MDS0336858.1 hypothetical protein [Mycobacterium intracellulare]
MSISLEASAHKDRIHAGGATEDTTCGCSVCRSVFEGVEQFERHRARGHCRKLEPEDREERAAIAAARRYDEPVAS